MSKSFDLKIVTPVREFFSGEAESLIINTISGELGIMRNTLPFVTVIKSGVMRICQNGRWMEAIASDGFVSVIDNKVTVLTQTCEWPYEIDLNEIDGEIDKLNEKERKAKSLYEYKMAKAQLAVQFAKLKIKNHGD